MAHQSKSMKLFILSSLLVAFLTFAPTVHAGTSYVLPYPSSMPGSSWYKARLIVEAINKYLYFGNLSQFRYNLELSDKYLIESKTLFEYNQLLLGSQSLKKSDKYFQEANVSLGKAMLEKKEVAEKMQILKNASAKHVEVLETLKKVVPQEFTWTPEKEEATQLNLHNEIDSSISQRKQSL